MRLATALLLLLSSGCGSGAVADPFADAGASGGVAGQAGGGGADAAGGAGGAAAAGGGGVAGDDGGADGAAGALGRPCSADAECDDGIDCTFDACDGLVGRCRSTPDDARCQDAVHCDGVERCDARLGCREGAAATCSDGDACTLDRCDEASRGCVQAPRDADGDGDAVWNCLGGGDCNDQDARVSSLAREVCANRRDDDCDAEVDEADCSAPSHDTCVTALEITAPGTYPLSLVAAALDYPVSCAGQAGWRDVVLAVAPPGPALTDVDIVLRTTQGQVALAAVDPCGGTGAELACQGTQYGAGGYVSRLRLRSLAPGFHAVYALGSTDLEATLEVAFLPPTAAPGNETCGTATPLTPGVPVVASVLDPVEDVSSACGTAQGELVYAIEVTTPSDLRAFAESVDGMGDPELSLLGEDCRERTCRVDDPAYLFARGLAPGTHYLAVGAGVASDVQVRVELAPATAPPAGDTCALAPVVAPGAATDLDLGACSDDIPAGCSAGTVDGAVAFDLAARSDVLVLARYSQGDRVSVGLTPDCADPTRPTCGTGSRSPARVAGRALEPGRYYAVAESALGLPVRVTPLVRPAVAPVLVAFADTCDEAVVIPPGGGFFQGNTANVRDDLRGSCDQGGSAASPDQWLRFTLTAPRRVVLDMAGSAFAMVLAVREGPSCPGTDLPLACAAGYYTERSFLDLTLDPGTYFVQVDGYSGQSGEWFLDVHVL